MATLRKTSFGFAIGFAVCIVGCSGCHQGKNQKGHISPKEAKEKIIDANKSRVEIESDRIDEYVKRHNWNIKETGTGLRYMVYEDGTGPKAQKGQVARVDYEVSLLDGTVCYTSDSTGSKEFTIGMDNVESGLHEGITYMRTGSKAKMILPAHLAHGLLGDRKKIPANAAVVYDIELLELK